MSEKKSNKSLFDELPPKFAFWAGAVASAAILSIVAVIILVALMLTGVDIGVDSTKSTATGNTTTTTTTTATADSIDVDTIREDNTRGDGELIVVEYSDVDCPFCQRFHGTMQQVLEEYDGQVQWSYKHFPLTSLHPDAAKGAEATECAAAQGKFWEFTDIYMDTNNGLTGTAASKYAAIAEQIGLDTDEFADCTAGDEFESLVTEDATEAQSLGGRGTPFSVIIDEDGNILATVPGALPFEPAAEGQQSMKTILDSLLEA